MDSLLGTSTTNKQQQQQQQQLQQQQQQLMRQLSIMDPKGSIVNGGNPLSSYGAGGNSIKQKLEPSSYTNQLIKKDRGNSMFMASDDDSAMIKEIQETHAPDEQEVDVNHLLHLVEDILNHVIESTPLLGQTQSTDHEGLVEDSASNAGVVVMPDALSYLIDRISCEIACKCLTGCDAHGTIVSIFTLVSRYTWDAKLVLILAAFAHNYGEFWLLAQSYLSIPLAKSVANLTQLPVIIELFNKLKPRFDALTNLINVMLEVTRCIVNLNGLVSSYISQDVSELNAANAYVPTAVYWTIRSVVACATQIHTLSSMGHKYIVSTTEKWELSTLPGQLKGILEHIEELQISCSELIEKKKEEDDVAILEDVFKRHIGNMKPLKLLINAKDEIQPLFYGSEKIRVDMDVLRNKNVLLLISGLDISQDELKIIKQTYEESRTKLEVLWIPIVDPEWDDKMQSPFEDLQSEMPWYTVHPKLIERASKRFIKEEWQFRNKAIVVVLDPKGKVVSPNAIDMIWIWGSKAFPFTIERERSLWQTESKKLELLFQGINENILKWMKEEKYIILYGGDDIKWIQSFTAAAHTLVASAQGIQLEMAYVGRSGKKEQQLFSKFKDLSNCWNENGHSLIWTFWTRLERMFFSQIQLKQADDDQDSMTQAIKKILSYDKSYGGWAVLSKGSSVILTGHDSTILDTLEEFEKSEDHAKYDNFDKVILEYFNHTKIKKISHQHRYRFELPIAARTIPEEMKCPECTRLMEKFIAFVCYQEDNVGGHDNATTLEPNI